MSVRKTFLGTTGSRKFRDVTGGCRISHYDKLHNFHFSHRPITITVSNKEGVSCCEIFGPQNVEITRMSPKHHNEELQSYSGDEIQEVEIGVECGTYGR